MTAAISINKQPSLPNNVLGAVAATTPKTTDSNQTCWFCGNSRHTRSKCPARKVTCHKCKKDGHFEKICTSASISAAIPKHGCLQYDNDYCYAVVASANSPFQVTSTVLINDTYKAEALIDSGCIDESFICKQICNLENSSIN